MIVQRHYNLLLASAKKNEDKVLRALYEEFFRKSNLLV